MMPCGRGKKVNTTNTSKTTNTSSKKPINSTSGRGRGRGASRGGVACNDNAYNQNQDIYSSSKTLNRDSSKTSNGNQIHDILVHQTINQTTDSTNLPVETRQITNSTQQSSSKQSIDSD